MNRPTVPECLDEAVMLLRVGMGCGLHVVLDDGNVEDVHVRACAESEPFDPKHPDHRPLARKMLLMTKTQRRTLGQMACAIAYKYEPPPGPKSPDVFGAARNTFTVSMPRR